MASRFKKAHPALKHGGYCVTELLPGEDEAAFRKLQQNLQAELLPNGVLEEDIVAKIARLLWRKKNLSTLRNAQLVQKRFSAIRSENIPEAELLHQFQLPQFSIPVDPDDHAKGVRAAEAQARKEFGGMYELVEMGDSITIENLMHELEVEERVDALIEKCLKRFLFLRGIKSISPANEPRKSEKAKSH